ncbi:hypothetical protein DY000_02062427 [Brassica cretica]|uniref:Uncharacterized protein n=1 Tax=Brassica cretica TaxID=69181 RepID=A0ABQ7B0A3_BRACR|nr:hypothetical protein DY000_02062427 [Brassica cretica]
MIRLFCFETFPRRLRSLTNPSPLTQAVPGSPYTCWGRFQGVPEPYPFPSRTRLFDNFQAIANTNLELSDVVGQIRSVQGSDLSKETTRVVIHLLIDP